MKILTNLRQIENTKKGLRMNKYFEFENYSLILNTNDFVVSKDEFKTIRDSIDVVLNYHNIKNTEVGFTFVTPSKIREINREFRGIDRVTDVLSFPIDEEMLGDIVVCKKRCYYQARAYGNSYLRELSYLTVHSVLHLLGYDHMTKRDKRVMRRVEKEIMRKF